MRAQSEQNLITPAAADALLAARDGDMALLYLYFCRTGSYDLKAAGLALMMPSQRLKEAAERLEMCGLLHGESSTGETVLPPAVQAPDPASGKSVSAAVQNTDAPLSNTAVPSGPSHPSGDLPSYTTKDVADRTADPGFSAIVDEARRIVGRNLSSQDLVRLLGIYDYFDLPAEVMMEMMHYVAEVYREKYGTGRLPSVGAFEREARGWVRMNITDLDAAEAFLRSRRDRRGTEEEIKEILQVKGRDFTDTERRYVDEWVENRYRMDVLAYAYDKTVTNTRRFSPAYMNRILLNWKEKGLLTRQEILQSEKSAYRASAAKGPAKLPTQPTGNPAEIRVVVDQI